MKNLSKSVIIASLLFSAACKKSHPSSNYDFTVVTSFYPIYIIAKNVTDGVNGTTVINMTPPVTGCLHDYTITAGDMTIIEKAGIFLMNGAGMENFSEEISKRYPDLTAKELSAGVKILEDNPHIWLSLDNMIIMTMNCSEILSEKNPSSADKYRNNARRYVALIKSLKNKMHLSLDKFKGTKIVTFHEAFPYFAEEFGLQIAAVIEREPGSEPSAKELADTIKLIKNTGIRAVFTEPQYPKTAAEIISKETGTKVFVLDPAVTGSDNINAFIDIMEQNLSVLEKALR